MTTATLERPLVAIDACLSGWLQRRGRSFLREMVELVTQPGVISLAGGLPDARLFPAGEYAEAVSRVLAADPSALQYRPPLRRLKEQIVELMASRGVECRVEQIVLTAGAQQGLDILSRALIDPGSPRPEVAYEDLTFVGIHHATVPTGARVLALGTDLESGLDVDRLAVELEAGHRPAFLYVIPDAHNPLGVSLSVEKRQRLVELAARYGMPIVEDDPYGLLSFEGAFAPPLRALDEDWVFYVGSFSKILAPGLRLGWIVAPEPVVGKITIVKEAIDLECSSLTQRAVSLLLEGETNASGVGFSFDAHLARLRSTYAERGAAMIAALERSMPADCRFTRPRGGMFVWVELPESVDAMSLFHQSLAHEKVAFVPGSAFSHDGAAGRHAVRLSFSTLEPEQIGAAVEGFASALKRFPKNQQNSS